MEQEIENKITFVEDGEGRRIPMRSRLEARWAVFFSRCGLTWSYEPKTFALPSGIPYTPDFHVAGVGWFEIKPNEEKLLEGRAKILEFCEAANILLIQESDNRFFVSVGSHPRVKNIFIGYSPTEKASLIYRFWRASKLRPFSFTTFRDKVIPCAEQAALEFRQNEISMREFTLTFRHKELGTSFRKLAKEHLREEEPSISPQEFERGRFTSSSPSNPAK